MKTLRIAIIIFLLGINATAMAAPPSEGDIKQLLAVTEARNLVDEMVSQINSTMNYSIEQALKGKSPNAKQQKAIDKMKTSLAAFFQDEMSWDKLESMYIRLYKETFTEEEVKEMLTFYNSPVGRSVTKKMPLLMQKAMAESQKNISQSMQKLEKITKNFIDEVQAASK
jgi:hypothetical protein